MTLEFPFTYNDYINPYFLPLKHHLCIWALEIVRKRVRVKVWTSVRRVWGLKPISRILPSNEDFASKKTCQSEWNMQKFAKMAFGQTFLRKTSFDKLFSILWTVETNFFILIVKNIFSIESQRTLIQIKWLVFHCDLEAKIFHMNSSWFFQVFDEISSTVHGFEAV